MHYIYFCMWKSILSLYAHVSTWQLRTKPKGGGASPATPALSLASIDTQQTSPHHSPSQPPTTCQRLHFTSTSATFLSTILSATSPVLQFNQHFLKVTTSTSSTCSLHWWPRRQKVSTFLYEISTWRTKNRSTQFLWNFLPSGQNELSCGSIKPRHSSSLGTFQPTKLSITTSYQLWTRTPRLE